jgi:DNA polymerase-3 subunit delta
MKAGEPAPVYLFLGHEPYRRMVCRRQLVKRTLSDDELENGLTRHDLDEITLAEVIDDARALSLFAPKRLIWATSAEATVPRGRTSAGSDTGADALADYLRDPSPNVVLVFEASRFALEGEGKKKLERVQKFYSAIPRQQVVEFPPYNPAEAHRLGIELAKRAGLKIGDSEMGLLAEAVGHDANRIAVEIEKLRLFAGENGEVVAEDIARLVPSARAATIFELVSALGRGDRRAALGVLDTLVQEGEYLPLALSFLETQFRHALVAREMGLRNPKQIQDYFQKMGARVWYKKAQEISQTAALFSPAQLKAAIANLYQADKGLRDARPDDRTIVEQFVLGLGKK